MKGNSGAVVEKWSELYHYPRNYYLSKSRSYNTESSPLVWYNVSPRPHISGAKGFSLHTPEQLWTWKILLIGKYYDKKRTLHYAMIMGSNPEVGNWGKSRYWFINKTDSVPRGKKTLNRRPLNILCITAKFICIYNIYSLEKDPQK